MSSTTELFMPQRPVSRPGVAATPSLEARAISIRPAVPADAEACGRIMYEAFKGISGAHGFPPDFASPADATGLATAFIANPSVFGVVAEIAGSVVGSNFLSEGDLVRAVGPITVDPSCQGGGVGRRLMQAVLDRAGGEGRVRLVQAAFNTRSVSLYASLGFEVKEPLLLMQGTPRGGLAPGFSVRPMVAADVAACAEHCTAAHGLVRTQELRDALAQFAPMTVERNGRVTGYLTAPGFWIGNHGVAETEQDMAALIAGAAAVSGQPVSLLLPTRQSGLFRWCLGAGMRVVQPMTLMARGAYREPRGAWFPSVLY